MRSGVAHIRYAVALKTDMCTEMQILHSQGIRSNQQCFKCRLRDVICAVPAL